MVHLLHCFQIKKKRERERESVCGLFLSQQERVVRLSHYEGKSRRARCLKLTGCHRAISAPAPQGGNTNSSARLAFAVPQNMTLGLLIPSPSFCLFHVPSCPTTLDRYQCHQDVLFPVFNHAFNAAFLLPEMSPRLPLQFLLVLQKAFPHLFRPR